VEQIQGLITGAVVIMVVGVGVLALGGFLYIRWQRGGQQRGY
jgi:Tfp pilus assembly protein PilN